MSRKTKPTTLGTHATYEIFRKGAGSKTRYFGVDQDAQDTTREFASREELIRHIDTVLGMEADAVETAPADAPQGEAVTEIVADADNMPVEDEPVADAPAADDVPVVTSDEPAAEPEATDPQSDIPVVEFAASETETVQPEPEAEQPAPEPVPYIHACHLKYSALSAKGLPMHIPVLNCFSLDTAMAYSTPAGGPNCIINSRTGECWLHLPGEDGIYVWKPVSLDMYKITAEFAADAWESERLLYEATVAQPAAASKAAETASKKATKKAGSKPAASAKKAAAAPRLASAVSNTSSWKNGDPIDPAAPFGVGRLAIMRWFGAQGYSLQGVEKFMADHALVLTMKSVKDQMAKQESYGPVPVLSDDAAAYLETYKAIEGTVVAKAAKAQTAAAGSESAPPVANGSATTPAVTVTAF